MQLSTFITNYFVLQFLQHVLVQMQKRQGERPQGITYTIYTYVEG
jgi:hypothetical protein